MRSQVWISVVILLFCVLLIEGKVADVNVTVAFTVNETYHADYDNKNSSVYTSLSDKLEIGEMCGVIRTSLADNAVIVCRVVRFSNGSISIKVEMLVTVNQTLADIPCNTSYYENMVKTAILQANSSGTLGGLYLYSLNVTAVVPTCPSTVVSTAPPTTILAVSTTTTDTSSSTGAVATAPATSGSTGAVATDTATSGSTGVVATATATSGSTGAVATGTATSGSTGTVATDTATSGSIGTVATGTATSGSTGTVATDTATSGSTGVVATATATSGSTGAVATDTSTSGSTGAVATDTATSGSTGVVATATTAGPVQPTATTLTPTPGGETTTGPNPTTEVKVAHANVTVAFTINGTFIEAYNDPNSSVYKSLANKLEGAMCRVIRTSLADNAVIVCRVVRFSNGSIVAVMLVIVDQNLADIPSNTSFDSIVKDAILQANSSGTLGGLNLYSVDVTAVVPTRPSAVVPPPAPEDDDDGLEGWEIALIVIFVLILIGVVVFIVFLVVYKKKTEPAKEMEDRASNEHMGATNPTIYDNADDRV